MSYITSEKNGRFWFSTVVVIVGILLLVASLGQANADDDPVHRVHLQTADVILNPGVYETGEGRYMALQLGRNLHKAETDALADEGVRLLSYLGDGVYIAGIDTDALTTKVQTTYAIETAVPWRAENKATPALRQGITPDWARTNNDLLKLTVLFFADVAPGEMEDILNRHATGYKLESPPLIWAVEIEPSKLDALLYEEGIHFVEPGPIPFLPLLDESRALIHVDEVQQASFTNDPPAIWYDGLTGKGITLQVSESVWDGHPDFIDAEGQTRFMNPSPDNGSEHGTHVAGIIGGDGLLSATLYDTPFYANTGHWRGMAPEATLYDWRYSGDEGILIDASNHSYVMDYGTYGSTSVDVDRRVRGESGRELRWPQIWAVANQGHNAQYPDEEGYYSLYAPAKNSIAVGSVNANDGGLSTFSSLGPTFDGRVKPDVMAPGGKNHFPRAFDVQTERMQVTFDFIRVYNARTGTLDAAWEFNQDGNAEGWFESGNSYNIFNVTVSGGTLTFDAGFAPDGSGNELPWGWNESVNIQTDPDHEITIKYKMSVPSGANPSEGVFWFHQSGDPSSQFGKMRFRTVADGNWIVETTQVGQWGLTSNNNFGGWTGTIDKLGMVPFANDWPEVSSTFYDDVTQTYAYSKSQGTSMAAPAVTGGVGLILQQFRDQLGIDLKANPPLPSTIKAVLVQTAEDMDHATADPRDPLNPDTNTPVLYYAGPDFATGYGLVNIQSAVDLVGADPGPGARSRFIHEGELDSYQKHVYEMYLTSHDVARLSGQLKFTLVWDDFPGDPTTLQTDPKLVNDLDLYLVGPDNKIYLPWTLDPLPVADCDGAGPGCGDLDPIEPSDVVPAQKAADHRNNVEMVQVETAVAGLWYIVVDAHSLPLPMQNYSLVGNHLSQAPSHQTTTTLVSVDSEGNQANILSLAASISENGRYIAYESYADNLVNNDTNASLDIFVRDRQYGQTSRVSVSSAGEQGNSVSYVPTISSNGRYVAFQSDANNLVPNDTNGALDFFVHDLQTGQTSRVSVNSAGEQATGVTYAITIPALSADGRFVAFHSSANNLVTGDSNNVGDVFVHDRQTGQTTRVSINSQGNQGNGSSGYWIAISGDGRYVAFDSTASNLVSNDSNNVADIFVHDRQTGQTTRVSVNSQGNQGNGTSGHAVAISGNGRYVAFESNASNLVNDDNNDTLDIFVHDRHNGQTRRVSIDSSGNQSAEGGSRVALSADGRYVAFKTKSALVSSDTDEIIDIYVHDLKTGQTTRVPYSSDPQDFGILALSGDGRYVAYDSPTDNPLNGDANNERDIFVHDRGEDEGLTTRVSVDSNGNQANASSGHATLSGSGRYVAFESSAINLVNAYAHGSTDIYIRDNQTGQTTRITSDFAGNMTDAASYEPEISFSGRYVAYWSEASNLVYGDTNNAADIFVYDHYTNHTSRISVNSAGNQSNGNAYSPSLSSDGQFVAFQSDANNLVGNDNNDCGDVFVHNRNTGQTFIVSLDSVGNQGNNTSWGASISDDGRFIAFRSYANNLVNNDSNGSEDVFVHDRQTGQTTRVSVDSAGNQSNSGTLYYGDPVISADGRYVVFNSDASNLVSNDTNSTTDIFVHDRQTGQTKRVSVNSAGDQANNYSGHNYALSPDGRYVTFESDASNLVADDTNNTTDIFVHDQITGQTTRVSVDSTGKQGYAASYQPAIAADGQFVVFTSDAINFVRDDTNGRADIFMHEQIEAPIEIYVTYLPNIMTNP